MELNIFTNCSDYTPKTSIIRKTYKSFCDNFGVIIPTIYVDPSPNEDRFDDYVYNLSYHFPKSRIIKTNGLADGYLKSLKDTKEDYMFQLEYDWSFQNIKHNIDDILKLMKETGIYNFRFNKSTYTPLNYKSKYCTLANQKEHNGIKYIETDCMSNNPHIIDRKFYLENIAKHIKPELGKSFGLEEILNCREFRSNVYGEFGDEPCIKHLTKLTMKKI